VRAGGGWGGTQDVEGKCERREGKLRGVYFSVWGGLECRSTRGGAGSGQGEGVSRGLIVVAKSPFVGEAI